MSSPFKTLPAGDYPERHHNPATTVGRTFKFITNQQPSRRGAADVYTFYDNKAINTTPDKYEGRLNRAKKAYDEGYGDREEIRAIAREIGHETNVGRQEARDEHKQKREEKFRAQQEQRKVDSAEKMAKRAAKRTAERAEKTAKRAEQTAKGADKTLRKFEGGSGIKTRRKRKASRRKRRRASAKAKRKASRRKGRKAGTRSKR